MTEAEYRRAQEYILEAWQPNGVDARPYALGWLAYIYVYPDRPPGKAPTPAAFGLTTGAAEEIADAVETLILDLRDPRFGQDDPQSL